MKLVIMIQKMLFVCLLFDLIIVRIRDILLLLKLV